MITVYSTATLKDGRKIIEVDHVRESRRRAHKHAPKTPRPQVVPDRRKKLRDKAERKDRSAE